MCNGPGALQSSRVSSLAALVPYSGTRRLGSLPGYPESIRKWEHFPPAAGTTHIPSGKTNTLIHGPLKYLPFPCPYHCPALWCSFFFSGLSPLYLWKTCVAGSCCTRENLSTFTCVNPALPTMAYQGDRWHACLNIGSPPPQLWGESSIYAAITCFVFTQIHNTKYYEFSLGAMMRNTSLIGSLQQLMR